MMSIATIAILICALEGSAFPNRRKSRVRRELPPARNKGTVDFVAGPTLLLSPWRKWLCAQCEHIM